MGKNNSAPIGIFDSGVGGLTVARSVIDQLPNENIVYIGDSDNTPYGDKPFEDVRGFSKAITDDLILRGCKVIVIACNTATAAFEDQAKELYDVPVLEVITPAVRRALAATHSGKIGVIGTQGTIDSEAYQKTFEGLADPDQTIEVYAASCPQFAPFVERGVTSGPQILSLAESYLEPLKQQGIDTLVLGCTHYPLLTGVISIVMGDEVTLVSSAEETAKNVYKTLNELDLLNQPSEQAAVDSAPAAQTGGSYTFESTGDPQRFAQLAHRFLGPSIMSPLEMER